MERFAHLSQRLVNTPLMIHPRKAEVVFAALSDRLGYGRPLIVQPQMFFDDDDDDDGGGFSRPGRTVRTDDGYDILPGGVAQLLISGTLVQKLGSLRPSSGMTGYNGVRQRLAVALDDPNVEAIMLEIDSGGGEVAGCFDLVDDIYRARQRSGGAKPIWAVLAESAYSAAYAIASACDRITVPRTGGVGSIGVIVMHVDLSRALDANGIKVTLIHYGAKKADGHPEIALSDSALDEIQTEIDSMGTLFVETVARNRGLSVDAVRATQAGTYLGAPGVKLGLADAVAAPGEAYRQLLAELA